MGGITNIIDGWKSYLKKERIDFAKARAEHCKKCHSAIIGTYETLLPDYSIKEIQGLKCKECGCPLSTKLRSKNEKCPLGNW